MSTSENTAPPQPSRDLHADGATAGEFASLARRLHSPGDPDEVHARITRAAAATVPGCDHAAISLVDRRGVIRTVAPTDDIPTRVDALQHELGHGPCLDAIADHETYLIDDVGADERWPELSRRIGRDTGVRSLLAFRLFVDRDSLGALNLYSRRAGAFTPHARAVGAVLAAHAATAIRSAHARERAEGLETALSSSRTIGVALGIVMARREIGQQDAFEVLRRASQEFNTKLRDIAESIVDTGQVPGPDPEPPLTGYTST